jgi:sugar/nucleoside kinase (ribokinase family)
MRSGIAGAGNWIVDRVKLVDHWPQQDTLANILGETTGNGGGAFNLLVDLAKLGVPFPLEGIGLVGKDAAGGWIFETCNQHRIQTDFLKSTDAPTSYTDVITAKDTGRRTFFHQRGANSRFGPDSFEISEIESRIFYFGYALLLDSMDAPDTDFGTRAGRLLANASKLGMKTAMDVVSEDSDRFEWIVSAALPHLDWLFMNEFEAERTVGYPLRKGEGLDRQAMEAAAQQLLKAGVHEAVFLHAPEGAYARSANGDSIWQPSVNLPAAEIAGTVGAGDAFAAGVLFGLHDQMPLRECLLRGVCAAAASLRHPSASEGVLPLEMCISLAGAHGFRPEP